MATFDLSELKKKSDHGVAFEDLSPEDQENLAKMAEEAPEDEGERVRTAFLVIVAEDGSAVAVPDLNLKVVRDHIPSTDDIYAATTLIQKDIHVQEGAQITASFQYQMAMQAQQQMQAQRLAQGLHLPN